MFEGKPPHSGPFPSPDFTGAGEDLRPVTWSDLVARLDAVRDLRSAMRASGGEGEASFDPGSARHIAALCDGKPGVNLDDLVNGKAAGGISCRHQEGAAGGAPRE
jgi:hypothetical protein